VDAKTPAKIKSKTVLTGVKPTGTPHIGNYVGAIKPAIALAASADKTLLFIADYHALTTEHDPKQMRAQIYEVAATWLACGLDPNKVLLYRQSDIPEVFELSWALACFTPKGAMNRAHAYKAIVQANIEKGVEEVDAGVNMGVFTYPVLMAADILLFDADLVPVGKDQQQHVEIARDVASSVNHLYGDLRLPAPLIGEETAIVPGLDGRKMSKSYDNTIPLFVDSKRLRKLVMRFVTDSSPPEAPKDPATSSLFMLYKEFATEEEIGALRKRYEEGVAWGHVKEALYEAMERRLAEPRRVYAELLADEARIDKLLAEGAEKARVIAGATMKRVREAIGVR
jgi:tryptophanyl-tRNA synthetase